MKINHINKTRGIFQRIICVVMVITLFFSLTEVYYGYTDIPKNYGLNHNIKIAMSTDNNYAFATLTSMSSILENANKDTSIDFYILLSGNFRSINKDRISNLINSYDNCTVTMIDMKDKFKESRSRGHITTAAYYRLSLGSLLPEVDKILYIDVDTISLNDLYNLFNSDISNYYISGVKDYGVQFSCGDSYARELCIKHIDQYINSGIMLMNLKKIREDNIEKRFQDFLPNLNRNPRLCFHDQDAINSVCYNRIKFLPLKYNYMQHLGIPWYKSRNSFLVSYTEEEMEEACNSPVIIHFSSGNKPWNNSNMMFYPAWRKYANIANKRSKFQSIKDGLYVISSELNPNMVLDIQGGSKEHGANAQLYSYNSTDAQKFYISYLGNGYYTIRSKCSNKSIGLEHDQAKLSTNVCQYNSNNSNSQKWLIEDMKDGTYKIISKCNNLCLDVTYGHALDGNNVWAYSENETKAQRFSFVKIG